MNSYGKDNTLISGSLGGMATATEVRATPLGRLENALNRLHMVSDGVLSNAMSLAGPWPQNGQAAPKDAPQAAGVFGAMEDIATAIHRICDRLEEANSAVSQRLP